MSRPIAIPCGNGSIRVYSRPVPDGDGTQFKYRAYFTVCKGERKMSGWSNSIRSTVASLLEDIPKTVLNQNEKDVAWTSTQQKCEPLPQAISHKTRFDRSPLAVAIFQTHPFEGLARTLARKSDGKVRVQLSRRGWEHVFSKWRDVPFDAFRSIREKCISMGREVPLISHHHRRPVPDGVKIIHQIFGLYRDGGEMSPLFLASSSAWQAYAKRHQCEYILWTADNIDLFHAA